MAAGVHGRARIGRSLQRRAGRRVPAGLGAAVRHARRRRARSCSIAHLAGVPGRWAPLVIGGALGLMTALVAGAPRREDGEG